MTFTPSIYFRSDEVGEYGLAASLARQFHAYMQEALERHTFDRSFCLQPSEPFTSFQLDEHVDARIIQTDGKPAEAISLASMRCHWSTWETFVPPGSPEGQEIKEALIRHAEPAQAPYEARRASAS